MLYRSPERAPDKLERKSVFLAGSIELGKAELWQPRVAEKLIEAGLCVFDPRRLDWDWSTKMDSTPGSLFEEQVSWEQDHLEKADLAFFRICGGETMAIVSMLEMGLMLGSGKPVVVQADPDYMRRANIEVTARRYGVPVFEREDEAVSEVIRVLRG